MRHSTPLSHPSTPITTCRQDLSLLFSAGIPRYPDNESGKIKADVLYFASPKFILILWLTLITFKYTSKSGNKPYSSRCVAEGFRDTQYWISHQAPRPAAPPHRARRCNPFLYPLSSILHASLGHSKRQSLPFSSQCNAIILPFAMYVLSSPIGLLHCFILATHSPQ